MSSLSPPNCFMLSKPLLWINLLLWKVAILAQVRLMLPSVEWKSSRVYTYSILVLKPSKLAKKLRMKCRDSIINCWSRYLRKFIKISKCSPIDESLNSHKKLIKINCNSNNESCVLAVYLSSYTWPIKRWCIHIA